VLWTVRATPADQLSTIPTAGGGWLDRLNLWRTTAGLPTLTENPTWSAGDYAHSLYMVKDDLVTHYETAGTPYYTAAGDAAARNGNIEVNSTTATTDEQAIDWWMAAPFHAMGMMDPRLQQTGFGAYREVKAGWQAGFTLDTIRGNTFSGGTYPVYWPGNGVTEPLTKYSGNEFPDPLQACPGYSGTTGLPVFVEVGGNVATTAGPTHTFTGNGTPLAHCVIDSSNTALASYLTARGGVIVVPQQPLVAGVKYAVSLTVNGTAYSWSFTVGPFAVAPAGWQSLGGGINSSPAVSSSSATRSDVFVRGSDNTLYQNTWNGSAWSGWTSLGGILTSSPAAVSGGANRIDVFVRGGDSRLYHKSWDGTGWSAWEGLGGILAAGPAVASWVAGRLDVIVVGSDNALWHKWWGGTQWSAWESLGGIITADPGASSWGANRIDVFGRGGDSALWQKSWDGQKWTAWQSLGGILGGRVSATSCSSGHLDVFALAADSSLYRRAYTGTWGAWQQMGGHWSSGPGAACQPSTTTVELTEHGLDSAVWQTTAAGS
jgi:hypothetical protein